MAKVANGEHSQDCYLCYLLYLIAVEFRVPTQDRKNGMNRLERLKIDRYHKQEDFL